LYRNLENRLDQQIRGFLREKYGVELERIVIEQPPKVEFGEYALPLAFELAKKLRKAPRKIAEELVAGIGPIEGLQKLEVAGAGYINARVDRGALAAALARDEKPAVERSTGKILVEHSSINPNKAAHIGHLRNAILGDTFVRLLRFAGREVDVQNYIDNTGVQVADVVVGFLHIEKKSRGEIEQRTKQPRFDYCCWDLYARVSQWYEQSPENKKVRLQTLHEIEQGGNETAAIAELISTAVLRRHLETMDRLDIEYDFLPRESEILRLQFWDAAYVKLKESGLGRQSQKHSPQRTQRARRKTQRKAQRKAQKKRFRKKIKKSSSARTAPLAMSAKTSPITCGSLGCWGRISDIRSSICIQTGTSAGFRRSRVGRSTRTLVMWRKTTTLSTNDNRKHKTQLRKRYAIWVTGTLPTISRTCPTEWSC
jgi:arginyl-tRNA synthetase